uniref:Uncharacterized protein n=1 Tax=Anguilla anguilla TaxID=7936 RepID=A0A0E9UQN7_ANGAN
MLSHTADSWNFATADWHLSLTHRCLLQTSHSCVL